MGAPGDGGGDAGGLADIKSRIREHLSRITSIPPEKITDTASYREDLGIDSLSLMELTVDLEYAFKIRVPEERQLDVMTVEATARLIQEFLSARRE